MTVTSRRATRVPAQQRQPRQFDPPRQADGRREPVSSYFGQQVLDLLKLKERLPRETYQTLLASLRNGINVLQSDLESGLAGFDDASFDCVILSQTLQAMRHTERIVNEMLRVGREAIVTFPNFGHWTHRLQILRGRMPVSSALPYQWYDTPNIHLCTVADFDAFLGQRRCVVENRVVLSGGRPVQTLPNLLGELAIYRFRRA